MNRPSVILFWSRTISLSLVVFVLLPALSRAEPPETLRPPEKAKLADTPKSAGKAATHKPAIKPLTKEQLDKLLAARLDGGLSFTFDQFANMFLVKSRLGLPYGVGLMTSSKQIAKAELQPIFPEFYEPTVKEFLDAIALETSSEWKYDPTSKFLESDVDAGPIKDLAIFEFTKTKREKPYTVVMPKGWKAIDKGHWVMHVPPVFPLGMDIYELGSYSPRGKEKQDELMKKVVTNVSLDWAKRVTKKDKVDEKELKAAKVGSYDALYFETEVPVPDVGKLRWRQWVFSVDNKCYFVVSTIFPNFESRIYPDVQAMLKSFEIKKPQASPSGK